MTSEAEQIASKLTRAQRTLLCQIALPLPSSFFFSSVEDEQALCAAGLIEEACGDDLADPTELGRRVAEYLRTNVPDNPLRDGDTDG